MHYAFWVVLSVFRLFLSRAYLSVGTCDCYGSSVSWWMHTAAGWTWNSVSLWCCFVPSPTLFQSFNIPYSPPFQRHSFLEMFNQKIFNILICLFKWVQCPVLHWVFHIWVEKYKRDWKRCAAAFSEAELFLPPCQVNCQYRWAAGQLCHRDSCVLRLVIQVFRLLLCWPNQRVQKWMCDILHLGVNMQCIKGPWFMYWLISDKKYLCHLETDVCTIC
jgi:hypothetical protein